MDLAFFLHNSDFFEKYHQQFGTSYIVAEVAYGYNDGISNLAFHYAALTHLHPFI